MIHYAFDFRSCSVKTLVNLILMAYCLRSVASGAEQKETAQSSSTHFSPAEPVKYDDGRPAARWRVEARDAGSVLKHGAGPNQCDYLGARDVWVWETGGKYFMHYDGAGPKGWLACLATSDNLTN